MRNVFLIALFALMSANYIGAQEEHESEIRTEKIKVFPNPATTVVNVLGLQNSSRAEIIVTDTYGNVVLEHRWAIKNKALNIPVTSLNSGIYVITIRSLEQKVQTKFYKQ